MLLLDELDKDRNQLDCFSFSVEAGDWEAESSILVFLEAGGSERTQGALLLYFLFYSNFYLI